jgi:hypothetical protein
MFIPLPGLTQLHVQISVCMQAFHMGEDGRLAPQKVAELASLPIGSSSFSRDENNRRGGVQAPKIERLAVIPAATSTRAHLVAITVDARRVFLFLDVKRRMLKHVYSKPSEGLVTAGVSRGALHPAGGGLAGGMRLVTAGQPLACAYSSNTLLVAERATTDGALSQLLAALPNPAGGRLFPQ